MKYKLDELIAASERYYSSMHQQMRWLDSLYKRTHVLPFPLPENIKTHRSSKATAIVDNLRDQMRMDEPRVTFQPVGTSQTARTHKALMEMWGLRVLERIIEINISDPLGQAAHDLLLRGAAAWKFTVADSALLEKPKGLSKADWDAERARTFPFVVRAVDPLLLYPSPGIGALRYMVEVQTRRVIDIKEQFPDWTDPRAKKLSKLEKNNPLREVRWAEFWDEDDYVIEADGEPVVDKVNPYGIIPYRFRYSGLGRSDATGDPRWLAIGVLSPMEGELEAEIEMTTAMRAAWMFHVFDRLLTEDNAEKVAKQFQKGPGAVIQHKPGAPPQWLKKEQPNPQMTAFLDYVNQQIDRIVPPALTQKAADFGIHQALLIGQALKGIAPIKKTLNAMAGELLSDMSRMMELFNISMHVEGDIERGEKERTVQGKDFSHHQFSVKFEATDPIDDDKRMLAGLAVLREGGVMSKETFRKKFMHHLIEDSDSEEERVQAERVVDQLSEMGLFAQAAMEEWQAGESVEQATESAATAGAAPAVPQAGPEQDVEALAGGTQVESQPAQTGLQSGLGGL